MAAVGSGGFATELLDAGSVLTVAVTAGSGCLVKRALDGAVLDGQTVAASATFGPYLHDMEMRISCFAGASATTTQTRDTSLQASGSQVVGLASLLASAPRLTTQRIPSIARGLLVNLRANIVAAGSTVTDAELDALSDPLDRLMRSTAWAKILDLWVPVGAALAASLIKIKGATTTTMTGIALDAGDYTQATGITPNGTDEAVSLGFNPTTAGCTASDWGYGVFATGLTQSGILAGTLSGAATYLAYATSNDSKINGSSAVSHVPYAGLNAVQISGGFVSTWSGGVQQASTASSTGTMANGEFTMLACNGGFWSSQTACGWAAWSPGLTASEMSDLERFFTSANLALWRPAHQPSVVCVGDSNTVGFGLGSPSTTRWSYLLSQRLGLTEDNQGLNATTMSDNDDGNSAARWVSAYPLERSAARRGSLLIVSLGTNDVRYLVPLEHFRQDYSTWLDKQLKAGYDPSQVILCSPPASTDASSNQARLQQFGSAIYDISVSVGCKFYDEYAETVGQASLFQADALHRSVAGHASKAVGLTALIAGTVSAGTVRRTP